jgi:hypothetical protein
VTPRPDPAAARKYLNIQEDQINPWQNRRYNDSFAMDFEKMIFAALTEAAGGVS